jgi:hypothetical protein
LGEQSIDTVDGSLLEPPCDERPLDQSRDEVLGDVGEGSKGRSERSNQPAVFEEKVDISFSDNDLGLPEEPHQEFESDSGSDKREETLEPQPGLARSEVSDKNVVVDVDSEDVFDQDTGAVLVKPNLPSQASSKHRLDAENNCDGDLDREIELVDEQSVENLEFGGDSGILKGNLDQVSMDKPTLVVVGPASVSQRSKADVSQRSVRELLGAQPENMNELSVRANKSGKSVGQSAKSIKSNGSKRSGQNPKIPKVTSIRSKSNRSNRVPDQNAPP